jgi:hypothetical protein
MTVLFAGLPMSPLLACLRFLECRPPRLLLCWLVPLLRLLLLRRLWLQLRLLLQLLLLRWRRRLRPR